MDAMLWIGKQLSERPAASLLVIAFVMTCAGVFAWCVRGDHR